MFELIRMDLRRACRQGYLFIGMALLIGTMLLSYVLMLLVSSPENLSAMAAQGAEVVADDYAQAERMQNMSVLEYLHGMLFNGAMWLLMTAELSGVFCTEDFTHGAAKNIFSLLGNPWLYLGARAVSLFVIVAGIEGALFLFALVCKPLSIFPAWGGTVLDWLQLYGSGLLLGWAMSLCMMFVSILFRREGVTVLLGVILGCGLLVPALGQVCRALGWQPLEQWTISARSQAVGLTFVPADYAVTLAVCAGWAAVYLLGSRLVLSWRDLA